jgi:hypothetical protein
VFLVSRIREAYVRSGNPREAIVPGFGQSGRVVTAAAIIMVAVFGAFPLDPDPVITSIGLSLAFGVLAEAFIVRLTLVPAVMALLGRSASKLPPPMERVMPDVDVQGEQLLETLHAAWPYPRGPPGPPVPDFLGAGGLRGSGIGFRLVARRAHVVLRRVALRDPRVALLADLRAQALGPLALAALSADAAGSAALRTVLGDARLLGIGLLLAHPPFGLLEHGPLPSFAAAPHDLWGPVPVATMFSRT